MQLDQIWIYPLKSARGIPLVEAEITSRGLKHDRRWMLVDSQGQFLTQRTVPQMAQIEVKLGQSELVFGFASESCQIPLPPYDLERIAVQVWRSNVQAQAFEQRVNSWFSDALQQDCRLVYLPDNVLRETNPDFAPGKQVSFADGYPYLIANLTSLEALNQHLEANQQAAIGIDRFRANLIVRASEAFVEDHWQDIYIGNYRFQAVKPCERCVMITTDQQSGERNKSAMSSLSQIHTLNQKVIFGQNLVSESQSGMLKCGDLVML